MENKSLTVQFTVANFGGYKKWDLLRINSTNRTAIIIRTPDISADVVSITLYPYKHPKNKILRYLKFQWLKLRVFLKIIE